MCIYNKKACMCVYIGGGVWGVLVLIDILVSQLGNPKQKSSLCPGRHKSPKIYIEMLPKFNLPRLKHNSMKSKQTKHQRPQLKKLWECLELFNQSML